MSGDVSFVIRSVEEGEGGGGDVCYTPDVQEFICQRVSALMIGLSRGFSTCDEAQLSGRTRKVLASA